MPNLTIDPITNTSYRYSHRYFMDTETDKEGPISGFILLNNDEKPISLQQSLVHVFNEFDKIF